MGRTARLAAIVGMFFASSMVAQSVITDKAILEKRFADSLSGTVWDGSYSIVGPKGLGKTFRDKYTIEKVEKVKDDEWKFTARVQYRELDFPISLTLPVKWAGDTPVITVSKVTIPGLGTFSARVLVDGDRYAGTWQHDAVGGHLWGKIDKLKESSAKKSEKQAR